jgi:predicted deacylase
VLRAESETGMLRSQTLIGSRSGPHVLILGGVHGDEYEPIGAIQKLSREIAVEELSGRVTFIPVVNEPAFSRLSRVGPDGLDLARTMPGSFQGTITERIAAELTDYIQNCDYLIDLHTGGAAMDISPLAGYMLHSNQTIRDMQFRMAKAMNLPIVWATSPELNGRTLSIARDAGIPAIYAEWGGGGGCRAQGVSDYVDGCLNILAALELIPQREITNRVHAFFEDIRSESGVLQRNYPAPTAGWFEPAVGLGTSVSIGDLLGRVISLDGGPTEKVHSLQTGPVILLRAIPSVQMGDCLATVLDAGTMKERFHV